MPAASLKNRLHIEQRRPNPARDVEGGASDEHAPLLRNGSTAAGNGTPHKYLWGEDDSSPVTAIPKKILHTAWKVLASNYVNVFLVFVPAGIIAGMLKADATLVFALNFIAIIPLAALLSFATEELAAEVGQTIGGLLNASFGNAVELIVSLQNMDASFETDHAVSRLASLLCLTARSALSRPACWAPFSQTFFLCLDSASLLEAGQAVNRPLTKLLQ